MMEVDNIVNSVLTQASEANEALLRSTRVEERPLDQENDLGNLLGVEYNELPEGGLSSDFLKARARDNVQLLFNEIWKLPTERVEEVIVAKLPPPTTRLPREKPIPKPKPLTKWEEYAKKKGIIKKKKKTNLVWDDVVNEWVPRYGYKKVQAETKKNWMMEFKGNAADDEDPFEKAIEEKREKIAKNELKRLRNIARSRKVKVPGVGLLPPSSNTTPKNSSAELTKAADLAKKSTASLGKFQDKLPSKLEKSQKKPKGTKRKFDPTIGDPEVEKAKNLKILENLASKAPNLDINKAVGRQINQEDRQRSSEKAAKTGGKGKRRGTFQKKKGGKAKAKGFGGGTKRR